MTLDTTLPPCLANGHGYPDGLFGLWSECPAGKKVAWGARAIVERSSLRERRGKNIHVKHRHRIILVYDRQSMVGDMQDRMSFTRQLNTKLSDILDDIADMFDDGTLSMDMRKLFTMNAVIPVFGKIVIKGNTNASGRYVYLIAYPEE